MSGQATGRRYLVPVDVHLILLRDSPKGQQVLLSRRAGDVYATGMWHLPSGHLDGPHEDVVEGGIREQSEETGLLSDRTDIRAAVTVHHRAPSGSARIGVFLVVLDWQGEPRILEEDRCDGMDWFSWEALPEPMVAYCRAGLDACRAGARLAVHFQQPGDPIAYDPAFDRLRVVPGTSATDGVKLPDKAVRVVAERSVRPNSSWADGPRWMPSAASPTAMPTTTRDSSSADFAPCAPCAPAPSSDRTGRPGKELRVGYTTPDEWDTHYAGGHTFQPLGDTERHLLAEHVPAPADGLALDVGCGLGELARHLSAGGYTVDAIDHAPAALTRAEALNTPAAEVTYHLRDIERDGLAGLPHPAYDLITFRLSWAFIRDRTRVLNRLREHLRPGGTLCVITPVLARVPDGRRNIALDDEEISLLCAGWGVVERHDADGLAFLVLRDPVPSAGPTPVLIAYAAKGRPSPHALTGAGVVVTDSTGRILLGWSARRRVWELPGGKNDPGEDFRTTAVRELQEETGLKADPTNARLLALLMDSVHGIPRMTAAVRITAHTGEPAVIEPDLIHHWEWHEVADLPALAQPLFTPSAHVIDTVWPGVLPGLPPVHRYPVAHPEAPEPAQQAALADELRQAMAERPIEDG